MVDLFLMLLMSIYDTVFVRLERERKRKEGGERERLLSHSLPPEKSAIC